LSNEKLVILLAMPQATQGYASHIALLTPIREVNGCKWEFGEHLSNEKLVILSAMPQATQDYIHMHPLLNAHRHQDPRIMNKYIC